ncbi:YgiW/YdeI family stress tolerance OB fold protein [Stutzerimonas kirkiae]|uniref:Stress-induced protein YgiW n=1 Tax=Stutzerimonas kirkiae TaxID=2211392 RepID=A0A4Q9R7W7_9GAMM|nr:NirD/YgiW/YdeI family stress tolerance protein [Stutzerimonas kirkiae]TBU96549.1 stress-induced protein YgiW [Stutzerimonas kirkiae]TBV02167.1 stress-induced protein YgiW [Stutzerimonas kirkiae]TBV08836.1 stress-induced protein YgiW [Stutzerimonas kirkiae]TBV15672.1 stress-induced protein YgiW [Stutzerimonas kirkiae]
MKNTAFALLLAPLLSLNALAAGYTGPGSQLIDTVGAALEAGDESAVVLQGRIVKRVKDEKYDFTDATGTIRVEIDDEDWPAVAINENTVVRLSGEVDRDLFGREIDVDRIEVINR